MKYIQKSLIVFAFLIYSSLLITKTAFASTGYEYNSCPYGVGIYGQCLSFSGPTPCTDQAPGSLPPRIYSIVPVDGNTVEIYFTQAQDPFDHYTLEYGLASDNYQYGITSFGDHSTGTVTVSLLTPNTTYYFRVRAGNGCATGVWSSEVSAKTKGVFVTNDLELTNVELTPSENQGETKDNLYTLNITAIDKDKNPVEGVKLTFHPKTLSATTGRDGKTKVEGLAGGQYTIDVEYKGYKSTQTINLEGETRVLDLTVQIDTRKVLFSPVSIIIIGLLLAAISILTVKSYKLQGEYVPARKKRRFKRKIGKIFNKF